jgi:hypothetical protein
MEKGKGGREGRQKNNKRKKVRQEGGEPRKKIPEARRSTTGGSKRDGVDR